MHLARKDATLVRSLLIGMGCFVHVAMADYGHLLVKETTKENF